MAEQKCRWKDRDGNEYECGREATHDDGKHCIFHAERKDAQEFRSALARLIRKLRNDKANKWDFSGFVLVDIKREKENPRFIEYNLFHRAVFPVKVCFREALFCESASFSCATFSGDASFIRVMFSGETYFRSTTFGEGAYFRSATFSKSARFYGVNFGGPANFGRAMFSKEASFSDAKFRVSADFGSVTFNEFADFRSVVFSGYADFRSVKFIGEAWFSGATFSESAWFDKAKFSVTAWFRETKFNGETHFPEAMFIGDAWFSEATFDEDADFSSAAFHCDANLFQTTFGGEANFIEATFSMYSGFSESTFCGDASFEKAVFFGDVKFYQATFRREMDFNSVVFGKDVDFDCASFARLGDFDNCIIKGRVSWIWPGVGKKRDDKGNKIDRGVLRFTNIAFIGGGILDLRRNSLQDDCKLEIHNCKMKYILLEGTNCTQIGFYKNEWPEVEDSFIWLPGLRAGRETVGDECYAREGHEDKSEWRLIRRTCQQLARRFREDLDHPQANEFDRGAFEMRRLEMKAKGGALGRSTYLGLSIYKYLSHYSGSMALPLIWWGLLVIVCAFLYSGLSGGAFVNPFTQWSELSPLYMWKMLCLSFKSAVSIVQAEVKDFGVVPSWGVMTISATQKLLSGILITFFIFAIRRRFKH